MLFYETFATNLTTEYHNYIVWILNIPEFTQTYCVFGEVSVVKKLTMSKRFMQIYLHLIIHNLSTLNTKVFKNERGGRDIRSYWFMLH